MLGTGVSLSGEFIILKTEQTIPRREQTITIPIPQQTIIIPSYDQTTDNHLGFILRRNGGNNYSVSLRELDDNDLSQITKRLDGNETVLMNASICTKENTWYNLAAKMSEDEITAKLYDMNSTLLKSTATGDTATSIGEFGILIADNTDTIIAFKNLKVETLDQPTQPVDGNHLPIEGLELSAIYIGLTMLLTVTVSTVAYIKKRKK